MFDRIFWLRSQSHNMYRLNRLLGHVLGSCLVRGPNMMRRSPMRKPDRRIEEQNMKQIRHTDRCTWFSDERSLDPTLHNSPPDTSHISWRQFSKLASRIPDSLQWPLQIVSTNKPITPQPSPNPIPHNGLPLPNNRRLRHFLQTPRQRQSRTPSLPPQRKPEKHYSTMYAYQLPSLPSNPPNEPTSSTHSARDLAPSALQFLHPKLERVKLILMCHSNP